MRGQVVKEVIDDNTDQRGARMALLTMNSINISEEVKLLTLITTHFAERFQKCQMTVWEAYDNLERKVKQTNGKEKGGYQINQSKGMN